MSSRTETRRVFANPDGTFTEDAYVLPQFVRQRSRLVPIDTDLAANPDGTYSPQAAEIGVQFSGGGDAPAVTVVRDGRSMSWTWPHSLPEPTVAGDTATYSNVLDDVDLKLKATSAGFSQLLVVKTAQAAASPQLKEITFTLDTNGVDVSTDDHGNLKAVNPAGQTVFTAPTPLMWDSSAAATTPRTAGDVPQPRTTSDFEVPVGSRDAAMGLQVTGDAVTLTPDQDLLTGADTEYPVYLDPSVSGSRVAWTIAYKKYPNTSFYNGSGFNGGTSTARVGYENETNGLARSYFRFRTANLWSTDKIIEKSTFRIKNTWSWSCSSRKVELWRTAPMNENTTWNNRPDRRETLDIVNDSKGWSSDCPAGNLAFDTTAAAKDAAAGKWNSITLGLKATDESDVYGWKKFAAKSSVLSTVYNTRPNVPSSLDTAPVSTRNSKGCGDQSPHGLIGNTDFYLTAKVKDRDGGTVKARFHLWPTGHHPSADPDGTLVINQTVSVTSGTVARVKVPKSALIPYLDTANGNFSWKAQADDGKASSDWNPTRGAPGCRFVFDPNRPSTPPAVSSTQFPDGADGWPAETGEARSEGTFTFAANGVADVTAYEYWLDTSPEPVTVNAPSLGAAVSIKVTPTLSGPINLYVRSLDKAGNRSDIAAYLFYVNGLSTPDKPGDLNGDGNADLWGVDGDGKLHRHYGNGDGTTTDQQSLASSIDWTNARITHRGDWTDDGYEDLLSLRDDPDTGQKRMWINPNNGFGFACTSCRTATYERQELTVLEETNNHWQTGTKQILAVGDVDGPLDTDNDGQIDTPGHPDLLVNDGQHLWLYYGDPGGSAYLDAFRDPVLLAAGDDLSDGSNTLDKVTMTAPGDFNSDGYADLVVRFDIDGSGLFLYDAINPDASTWPGQVDPTHRILIANNFGPNTVPMLTAAPDANNNDKLDLWTTTPNSGRLRFFADFTPDGPGAVTVASEQFANYQTLG